MSDEDEKSVRPVYKHFLRRDQLIYGEAYRTTKTFTWSNYDQKMERIEVPADELLIYRISQPTTQGTENVLFVWLNQKTTICLSTTDKSILFVKHMGWEERHRNLKSTEREDGAEDLSVPRGTFTESAGTTGREPMDPES